MSGAVVVWLEVNASNSNNMGILSLRVVQRQNDGVFKLKSDLRKVVPGGVWTKFQRRDVGNSEPQILRLCGSQDTIRFAQDDILGVL